MNIPEILEQVRQAQEQVIAIRASLLPGPMPAEMTPTEYKLRGQLGNAHMELTEALDSLRRARQVLADPR